MTASSSCRGTVDNFWSRDDVRVHTFGDLFEAKSTRTAGAKRRGAEAARQPVSADVSSRRKSALTARRHGADQGRQNAHDMERHILMVTDAVMCKLRGGQHWASGPATTSNSALSGAGPSRRRRSRSAFSDGRARPRPGPAVTDRRVLPGRVGFVPVSYTHL